MKQLALVTGGAASGKSAYAERRIQEMFSAAKLPEKRLIYLATMFNDGGPEAAARIRRHRALRAEKGFETIEKPCGLETLLSDNRIWKSQEGAAGEYPAAPKGVSADLQGGFILLEDLGNLLANELYLSEGRLSGVCADPPMRVEEPNLSASGGNEDHRHYPEDALLREYILAPLLTLAETASALVIVSNEIFSDGETYPPETMRYIRALGLLHRWIAEEADDVTEVVCGLPLAKKGRTG